MKSEAVEKPDFAISKGGYKAMNNKAVTPYELAQIIGADAVKKLNDVFCGRRYNFGKRAVLEFKSTEERDKHIRRLSLLGEPHDKLADRFGLSEKRIRDIVNYRKVES